MSLRNDSKIRIMFLHTGAELYGADQILLSVVSNLDKNVFEPIVVLPNNGPLVNKLQAARIRTEIIPYPIVRRQFFNAKGIIKFVHAYIHDSKKLCAFAKKENIDIVHNNTIAVLEGIYLKKVLGLKLISHVHEMMAEPKIVAKFLYSIHLKHCDEIIAVSKAVKHHIQKILGRDSNKIIVVHNGIALPKTEKQNTSKLIRHEEFELPKTAKTVAFIGRINAIKGQDDFVKALGQIIHKNKNIYGLIIGDAFKGQEWRVVALENNIKEQGLENNIIYCGFRNDVNEIYQIIDLLVLSSVKYDSFPTVVLEAMSRGVPTVAYKCGGVEEMLKNGFNGYLVEQGNTQELSTKIEEILNCDNILQKMRKNAKQHFEKNFTLDRFINNISTQYKDTLK